MGIVFISGSKIIHICAKMNNPVDSLINVALVGLLILLALSEAGTGTDISKTRGKIGMTNSPFPEGEFIPVFS